MRPATPAFAAFSRVRHTASGSMSLANASKTASRRTCAEASRRTSSKTPFWKHFQLCAANRLRMPGAMLSALSAASITMVPEPHTWS